MTQYKVKIKKEDDKALEYWVVDKIQSDTDNIDVVHFSVPVELELKIEYKMNIISVVELNGIWSESDPLFMKIMKYDEEERAEDASEDVEDGVTNNNIKTVKIDIYSWKAGIMSRKEAIKKFGPPALLKHKSHHDIGQGTKKRSYECQRSHENQTNTSRKTRNSGDFSDRESILKKRSNLSLTTLYQSREMSEHDL